MQAKKENTNKFQATHNEDFKNACKKAHVKPTPRQYSKYRNKKGIAYKVARKVGTPLEPNQKGYIK